MLKDLPRSEQETGAYLFFRKCIFQGTSQFLQNYPRRLDSIKLLRLWGIVPSRRRHLAGKLQKCSYKVKGKKKKKKVKGGRENKEQRKIINSDVKGEEKKI